MSTVGPASKRKPSWTDNAAAAARLGEPVDERYVVAKGAGAECRGDAAEAGADDEGAVTHA